MSVLKAVEFGRQAPRQAPFNLNDIAAEAQAMLEQARQQREALLAEARQQMAQEREEARQAGWAAGREAGLAEGRRTGHEQALQEARGDFGQRSEKVLQALGQLSEQFSGAKSELLWRAEQGTVALAAAIARKVVKKAGLIGSAVASENVKAALELVAQRTNVVIRVNGQDWEHLRQMCGGEAAELRARPGALTVEADAAIERGGCVLTTEQGQIDARLDTQVDRIADELLTSPAGDELHQLAGCGSAAAGAAEAVEPQAAAASSAGAAARGEDQTEQA